LLDVLTYTTGVEQNDLPFTDSFPYMAMPHSGTGPASGKIQCDDDILGSVTANDEMCDLAGIEITIYDPSGNIINTVFTDANGNYSLEGPFNCDGNYSAEITGNAPDCYAASDGPIGPLTFEVNGDNTPDGAVFSQPALVPTLSQWGLIILTLLLMTFLSIKLVETYKLSLIFRNINS